MTHVNDAKRTRPYAPGYGYDDKKNTKGMLSWEWVSEQMQKSRNYWICSTRPDGNPHAMPVWGVWHDENFYFSTGENTRKAKNIRHNPNTVVHLESGDDTVILEGVLEVVQNADLLKQVFTVYAAKYSMKPSDLEGLGGNYYTLRIRRTLAWRESDYPNTATRWIF